MKAHSIWEYIWSGTALRFLSFPQAGFQVHGDHLVEGNLAAFLADLETYELHVTHRLAIRLLGETIREFAEAPHDATLTAKQAQALTDAMETIRETMAAEASGKVAWIASDKRYSVERLMDDMKGLMAAGVYDKLSPIAQYDFSEAGRCIAFDFHTAGAFHLLRATEEALRMFYCSVVKKKRVSPLMWGPMVAGLRKRAKPPSAVLLNDLDSIRVTFRNPTDHPEMIYDSEGVQDLLNRCIEVVNRMSKEAGWI